MTVTSSVTRLPACTPEWFAMFGEVVADMAREVKGIEGRISFSEIYRNVPRDVAGHDGPVGWRSVLERGQVDFAATPDEGADIVIEVDYSFLCEMLREFDHSDELAARERRAAVAAAAAAGRFQVHGDLRRGPAALAGLHDAIAARTIQV
jgi:hypothetical protein